MKKNGTKNLTYTQRLQLEAYLKTGLHKKDIAEKLGVCLATVYNEIKRGAYEHLIGSTWLYEKRYSPNIAEDKYRLNMTSKGIPLKIGSDFDFVHYVEKRVLQDKLSPCAVLGEIKRKKLFNTDISKTTMYRYIAIGIFMNISLSDLPMGTRKKRYRKTIAKRPPKGISIEKRPDEIKRRKAFGHWEMDCVCGSTCSSLLVLTERLTRNEIIMPMPNQKTATVIRCLNILERRYGKMFRRVFKSITVDNGSEFADSKGIERSSYGGNRTSVYYCHPYCSSERGTNERLNREIRRRIPKGSDLSKFTVEDIQAVENWVNAYPREILEYATSAEMFTQELAALR
ncbi:IS30 family transposase [candidate division SR1 bacterium]|nr:IS30 family transposase [candidate division SR1 bacterium]